MYYDVLKMLGFPPFTRDGEIPSDLVVLNANIFTCDEKNPYARALAVKGERICYVGDNNGVVDYIGPDTRVVDGGGRMVVPGFVDNHAHVLWIGALRAFMVSLFEAKSLDDIKNILLNYSSKNPDHNVIMGVGWMSEYIPGGIPDKALADGIMSDRPLFLMSYSGNSGWVNSKALNIMKEKNPGALRKLNPKIDETTGEPTGVFMDFFGFNPFDYFSIEEISHNAEEKMFASIKSILDEALKTGVTTANDIQLFKPVIPLILKFKEKGLFDKNRVWSAYYVDHSSLEDEEQLKKDLQDWLETVKKHRDKNLLLSKAVKLYIEGVYSNHTSYLLEPYSDKPSERGRNLWSQEDLNRVMEIIDSMGLQTCTHCTGDGGIRMVINACEHINKLHGPGDARHRLEHCELPHPDDYKRIADLDIYASMQPTHACGDNMAKSRYGPERIHRFMPWGSLEKAGVNLSFGSDWCAGPVNPVYGLLISATRMNCAGETNWGPEEKVSLENAIRHYTIDSAKALKLEKDIGSLEVGKYADFALFSINLFDITSWWFLLVHEIELGKLDDFVIMTVLGGKIVYYKKGEHL